jgi:hypothetical protein
MNAVSSLAEQLEDAKAAVDALLAYVPKHNKELDEAPLRDAINRIVGAARRAFEGSQLVALAGAENGNDSFASHRVTLFIRSGAADDPAVLAQQEIAFHREANAVLTEEERLSIQLHVEFESADEAAQG